nr:hypothetical protein [Porphyromonas gingivicanis]
MHSPYPHRQGYTTIDSDITPRKRVCISPPTIGLAGNNPTLYGYVFDLNTQIDPFGLDRGKATKKGHQYERRIRAYMEILHLIVENIQLL